MFSLMFFFCFSVEVRICFVYIYVIDWNCSLFFMLLLISCLFFMLLLIFKCEEYVLCSFIREKKSNVHYICCAISLLCSSQRVFLFQEITRELDKNFVLSDNHFLFSMLCWHRWSKKTLQRISLRPTFVDLI